MMLHLKNAILISKDINVRVKCDALGIVCEDYKKARMASSIDDLYRGVRVVENVDEAVASFHQEGHVDPQTIGDFYPNEIVVLKTAEGGGTTLTRCDASGEKKVLVPLKNIKSAYGLVPKNKEQQFALDLLYDDKIKLVTLAGAAGCVVGATKVTIKVANGHWKMPEPVRYIDDIDE
jgi:PhoH-like ATPase